MNCKDKRKIKLILCLHEDLGKSGGKAQHIPKIGTRWRCSVSFKLQQLYTSEEERIWEKPRADLYVVENRKFTTPATASV